MREVTSIGAENLIHGLGCEVCGCGRYGCDVCKSRRYEWQDGELKCGYCGHHPPASMIYAYRWKALAKKLREESQQLRITKAFNEHEIDRLKAKLIEWEEGNPDIELSAPQLIHLLETPQDD